VGAAPAWEIPAEGFDSPRWAVLVHGRSSVRQEALRAVPAFHAAGWSTLLPSYRGDGEAPASPPGRIGFDDGAWLDVEAAVLHALDQGAREVVLMGWSTGAELVLQTAARSRLSSVLSGVVLDSPVLDAAEAVAHAARADRLPRPVRRGALSLAASRLGARVLGDDEPLDKPRPAAVRPTDLRLPVLVLHGDDDGRAPFAASRRLAEERPDLVTLVPFAGGRHTRLWNQDRARWERAVSAWLRADGAALGSDLGQPNRRQPRRSQRT
jgi:alpha-beta hydrolase superfamily lysophospholipase